MLLPVLLIVALACVAGATARGFWSSAAKTPGLSKDLPHMSAGKQRIEGELIVLTSTGFQPRQLRRPVGRPFLLAVENRSSLPVISIVLNSSSGLLLRNVSLLREKLIWSDIIELPPGTYSLSEGSHPDWVCNITIE
jgi:hypothetical protein